MTTTVKATAAECFDYVANHRNIPRFMAGIKAYEPLTDKTQGKGARFRSVAVIAGKEIEAEIEVTSWKDCEHMVATSRSGPKTVGSWNFAEYDDGTTDITFHQAYEAPGIFRLVPGRVVRGAIESGLKQSLARLKPQIESSVKKPAARKGAPKK